MQEQTLVLECLLQIRITHIRKLVAEISKELDFLLEVMPLFTNGEVSGENKMALVTKLWDEVTTLGGTLQ